MTSLEQMKIFEELLVNCISGFEASLNNAKNELSKLRESIAKEAGESGKSQHGCNLSTATKHRSCCNCKKRYNGDCFNYVDDGSGVCGDWDKIVKGG